MPVSHWSFFRYGAAAGPPIIMELVRENVERSTRRPQEVEAASVEASTARRSASHFGVRSSSASRHEARSAAGAGGEKRLRQPQQRAAASAASMEALASMEASAAATREDARANATAYAPRPNAATGDATRQDAAAQKATEEKAESARGVTACKSLSGSLARLPVSGAGSTSAADGEARARRRPGAVALSHAFPLRVGYSRLFSTIVMLSPRMRISEAPFGSGRLCIGVLSETPNGSGRPAFPQYLRTSTQHHVVLEEAEQQTCTREQLQANMHAYVHVTACIDVYRLFMSMYACLYMSAYLHMPVYLYRLLVSVYVHRCPRPRATSAQPRVRKRADGRSATAHRHVLPVQKSRSRTASRCKGRWHSIPTRLDPHPRGPAWHTANWLALHARLTWMIAGPSGTND